MTLRFNKYYSFDYIKKNRNSSSIIHNSWLKYGYSQFSLDILEYYDSNKLLERGQYFIDLLKPE